MKPCVFAVIFINTCAVVVSICAALVAACTGQRRLALLNLLAAVINAGFVALLALTAWEEP